MKISLAQDKIARRAPEFPQNSLCGPALPGKYPGSLSRACMEVGPLGRLSREIHLITVRNVPLFFIRALIFQSVCMLGALNHQCAFTPLPLSLSHC
ncbi:hypothetical protein I7I50_09251 [Histoplasma capsulatum G186AR]|uniref:Uncharacterized protein n=1 Tax=Ajellomyces capsulatus TaxID=5037 RepID=A0A8H7YV75_AJECA|nr:hypothetical protein I7I52_06772 [Histoplasma capsulatum]QSS74185.1 hypothetical protein I7I50_09251 [Histoplasma capsulatum G186AR]